MIALLFYFIIQSYFMIYVILCFLIFFKFKSGNYLFVANFTGRNNLLGLQNINSNNIYITYHNIYVYNTFIHL